MTCCQAWGTGSQFSSVSAGSPSTSGNVAGAGLGLNVLFGVSVERGAVISAAIAIGIFLVKEAGRAMDRFAQLMGAVMIVLTVYVAVISHPPLGEAVRQTLVPRNLQIFAIMTLVGGTVGGYIPFSGGHRLLDAGVRGPGAVGEATQSALFGIGAATAMRIALFLAALGVVSHGMRLDPGNPSASVFQQAAGNLGYKIFGVVIWAAAITSVVGSAWTSVSFVRTLSRPVDRFHTLVIVAFIVASTTCFRRRGAADQAAGAGRSAQRLDPAGVARRHAAGVPASRPDGRVPAPGVARDRRFRRGDRDARIGRVYHRARTAEGVPVRRVFVVCLTCGLGRRGLIPGFNGATVQ